MIIQPANRTGSVKEYYFSVKNKEIARMNADGRTEPVINLGIGSPNGRPPQAAIDALCSTAVRDGVHAYQPYVGIPELRKAFADWYARWYGVALDPSTEIQPLTGSKEGILIISLAFLNPGDKVLVPDPGYPTYSSAARLCEAEIVSYDLVESLGWQPDFEALEAMDLSGVKMMWTNYPNMPTGAPADPDLYRRLVDFGRRHGILVCNDNPYSFILAREHHSILAVPGAKDCCLELNSLSKAHNMAGWRIGMVAAAADVIAEILKVKSQLDSGMFRPLQIAAVEALEQGPEWFEALNEEYTRRRVAAGRIFDALGVSYNPDSQGLFLWGRVPSGVSAVELSDKLLHEAGVFITPGFIFGKNGENYLRISLCATVEVFGRALEKIKAVI
ncbi:MAG: aminotransferase class I/II-fold pyridoxal phosphate-dependent enzyme [Bacteroidales bacterium]|nr:aminotransferase class I/II-fold pyridoxal phosphate-dependent enzyme [Bacteroidales bacterium]